MKKAGKILLVVWAVLATFLLVMACVAYNQADADWSAKYDGLKEKSDALAESMEKILPEYNEFIEQENQSLNDAVDMVAVQSWANCVSEKNYVCKVDSETVIAIVYAEGRTKEKFMDDISSFASVLPSALKTSEYSKGIIVFMDDYNTVWAGMTVAADGESWPFVADSLMN